MTGVTSPIAMAIGPDVNVPVPQAKSAPTPTLVPPEISRAKLAAELENWAANDQVYRRRGWILLDSNVDELRVDVGFISLAAVGDQQVPLFSAAVRLTYENYDLWPPSLTFIEPRSGNPAPPAVQAIERVDGGEPRNALLLHPGSGRPFLCLPGLREYHSHPQHSGDDWLLHRAEGAGRLAVICDRIWRRMVLNVVGVQVQLLSVPGMGTQLNILIAQGDLNAQGPQA